MNATDQLPSQHSIAFAERVTALRRLLIEIHGEDDAADLMRSLLQTIAEARAPVDARAPDHVRAGPGLDADPQAGGPLAAPAQSASRRAPAPGPGHWSERDVVLITYGHTLTRSGERPLVTLRRFLTERLQGLVSTVHVLPFYPWSSDDGFAVIDYYAVDPQLGDWSDVQALADDFALMADLVINHVSRESLWFIDFIADREPGRSFFRVEDPETDLSRVVRPRNTPLLVPIHTYRGLRHVWATFSEDQIDLDFANPRVLAEMVRVLCFYIARGVRVIRLDAIAFLWKEIGTPCIHHANTHRVVRVLRLVAELICDPVTDPVVMITETNVPHSENVSYFGAGDEAHLVYQFPLAPLTLHALVMGTSRWFMQWALALGAPPPHCTFLNFTASHDGIGLRPAEGLLPEADIVALVDLMHRFGGFVSMRALQGGTERPYEINIALFDALRGTAAGEDDYQIERFLASQTLMLSLQGVPALYIHSLLGTSNDLDNVERTGRLRSINRREWLVDELEPRIDGLDAAQSAVFAALCRLLAIRRECAAFSPDAAQQFLAVSDALITLRRGAGAEALLVVINVTDATRRLDAEQLADLGLRGPQFDRIAEQFFDPALGITLSPYRCLWLTAADG